MNTLVMNNKTIPVVSYRLIRMTALTGYFDSYFFILSLVIQCERLV